MTLKLRDVKFSVFDPQSQKWITKENMAVLVTDDFIYVVDAQRLNDAAKAGVGKNLTCDDENMAGTVKKFYDELLVKHSITKELQGKIYSKNTLWKVEYEEKPYDDNGGVSSKM